MENIVFVITGIACTCIIVISEILQLQKISSIEEYNKSLETTLQQKFEKISSIEKYNKSLETTLQQNNEHIMMCILYKAVHIPEPIHGLKININEGEVAFTDVRIVDTNDKEILYNINLQRVRNGYHRYQLTTCGIGNRDLLIHFNPIVVKYIDFVDLQFGPMKIVRIVFLMENREVTINMKQREKNIICNTAAFKNNH